jgi:hypothetical protein
MAAVGRESIRLRCYQALPAGGTAPLVCDPVGLSAGWDVCCDTIKSERDK